jgi:gas vesicle protein
MAIDPLANINQSISEVEAAQDPLSAFNRLFSDVNSGFTPNPVPIISAPVPLTTSKAVNINQELVGNEATGPYPGVNDNTQQGNKSFVDSALDYMYDAETWAKDQYKYGRTYSYGAGWKNMQFERFYTHPQYKKLGFSPYRNNEELYNENSTWLDDWRRSSSQYWKLFSNAFGSSMFASDDFKASETMQEGMALGASSKDGVGSSITNFGLSSMYSLGIAAEVLVENIALTAVEAAAVFLAPETAGASLSVAGAAAIKQGASFAKFAKGISNMYEFLKTLKIAENAKSFYDASKIGKAGLATAKFLNPLGNTADFTRFLAKSEKSWSAVEKLALTAHGFSHFYNDLRGISLAVEESGLEGAMARSEYHQKLIDEYYAKYGTMPEGEAAKDIYQRAASVDFSVSMANLPTIMLSNKIVFNKFLKGFPSMSTIVKSIEKQSGRQLVKTAAGEVLEKGAIELTEKSAGKKAAEFFISSPYVPWSREYIAGNLTEALQENTQDAISTAVMAYHDKIDKDPSVAGFWEGVSQFGTGVQGQFGKQGLETFLSGYFTGSLVGGLQGGVVNAISGIKSRTKSGQAKVQAAKERSRQREDSIKESVNAMAMDAVNIGYHNATTASAVKNYAEEVDNAVDEGNPYKAHTMKDGMFNNHAFNLAQHNKTELFTEHIDDMLQLSDEDLTKAYAMSLNEASDLRKRLNNAKERAQDIQNTYNAISKEFANPVDLSLVDPKKNEALYKKMLYKYAAHQEAIKFITLSTESAKDVNGRILNIVNEFSQASPWLNVRRGTQQVSNAGASDIMMLLDSFQRDRAIETLELEADTLKEGTPEQKKKAKDKLAKVELLKKWSEVSNNFNQLRQLKAAAFKAKTQDLTEVTNKINEELVSEMYPLFDEYTKLIAKEQGGMLISKELNQAFNKIRDYYLLDQDYQGYVQSINILNDPLYFDRFINALETAQSQLKEKEAERIAEGFTKFMGYRDIEVYNEFFNKIYDIGLFVIPENVQEFFKNPRTAKYEIFDIASKEPVLPGSNKYEEFQKIIDEYYPATSTGSEPVVEGEIISEEAVGEAVTINTDINDMPKELQDELIAAFEDLKEYYKTQRPGDQFPFFNFPQFILRSGKAKQIIDNYNKKNGLVAKPAEATKKPEPAKAKAPVTPAPVSIDAKAEIIQTNEPNIQTIGNVTFGTSSYIEQASGKFGDNQDAVYVDMQNGVFILADGMGGETSPVTNPSDTSRNVIDLLLNNTKKTIFDDIVEIANRYTINDFSKFEEELKKLTGYKRLSGLTDLFFAIKRGESLNNTKQQRVGATALKAVKTGKNTYSIEKIGDTVFFVVDKNGNVIQQHGLSNVATTQGYMFSIKDGKPFISTPKTDNFTITLNEGETLVLATDFIETDKAIQDFINSDFGKKLDFAKFQKENKIDDSTFITIKYDAELDALESKAPVAEVKTRTIRVGVAEEIKPTTVAEVKEALKKLNEKTLQVSEDDSDFYSDVENPEDTWKRVSTLKAPYDGPASDAADRGTIIDSLLRDYIAGKISSLEDMKNTYEANPLNKKVAKFSERFIEDLFNIFKEVKSFSDQEGLELISNIPTLWGVINKAKYAGSIDLLGIDKKGNVYIIDLKTSSRNRRDINDGYYKTYKEGDTIQQSAYAELLRQRTGITVRNVVIFPIQVSKSKFLYSKAIPNKEKDKKGKDKFTMEVEIDKNLFPEQALSPEASEIQEVLKQEVEEKPEWYISENEAKKNSIIVKLKAIIEEMKIERTPDILDKVDKLENEGAVLPAIYVNEISPLIEIIKSQFKSISRIQIGDYIIFESNPTAKFEVVDKNENQLMLYNQALPMEDRINTEPEIVTKKDMYKVAKIIAGGAPEVIELTEEEKAINRTNTISADEFLANDEAVKEAYNSTKSVEETQKGIFEDLDNCKLQ